MALVQSITKACCWVAIVVEWQSFNNSLSRCGQLEGRRVGKGVIIITSAAPGKNSSPALGGDFCRYLKHFGTATWFPSYIGFIANYPIKNVIMIDDSYQNPCTQNNSQTSFLRTRSMTIDSGWSQMNNLVKFNSRNNKNVIMLIKMAGYRHFPHVKGFKASLNVSVSGLGVSIFMSFRQTRRSGSTGACIHEIMYIFTEQSKFIISAHALQCFDGYSSRG